MDVQCRLTGILSFVIRFCLCIASNTHIMFYVIIFYNYTIYIRQEYASIRTFEYHSTDLFVITFSTQSQGSYENVIHKWVPELRNYTTAHASMMVVGLNYSERKDMSPFGSKRYTYADARVLCDQIGLPEYTECDPSSPIEITRTFKMVTLLGIKNVSSLFSARLKEDSKRRCLMQ
jgi:hypothetical protein